MWSKVDLPTPEAPITAIVSPTLTVRLAPFKHAHRLRTDSVLALEIGGDEQRLTHSAGPRPGRAGRRARAGDSVARKEITSVAPTTRAKSVPVSFIGR